MARRGTALLASGLVAIVALGGAGGYGVGWLTAADSSVTATGKPLPLGQLSLPPTPASPTTTPVPVDSRKPVPDNSKALLVKDLTYRTHTFKVQGTLESEISLEAPDGWTYTPQTDRDTARFNETLKRYLRVQGGFPLTRPPAASMAALIKRLDKLDASQQVRYVDEVDDGDTATLIYEWVPPAEIAALPSLRRVIVRWVADDSGKVAVELSVTGLPKDAKALQDVMDHASQSVERRDSPVAPS
ncbi:hypothetical protein E1263_18885 [Kribbella antibiotica]|uniref:Uncharacterized protein n=1 Tax=Kribbella antibiotica TaxID=190195 RepID=A0A4R4ZIG1_9ACTN|nr:hypothetical protein [Kribbella antibiotica]TDD58491.1 hypothetical protein E1263_18885 [Kribbella antibiotica]